VLSAGGIKGIRLLMTHPKRPSPKPQFVTHNIKLTSATGDALRALAASLTNATGRKVSPSATLRALALYAARQDRTWIQRELSDLVIAEQGARGRATPATSQPDLETPRVRLKKPPETSAPVGYLARTDKPPDTPPPARVQLVKAKKAKASKGK
jgi:hypothetical protein